MDNRTYFHLSAFRGSVTNGTSNTAIAGVADSILTRSAGNNFLAPNNATIAAATGGGVNAARQRINTPAVRAVGFPMIAPLGTGVTIVNPPNLAYWGQYGARPNDADEVSVEATHTDAAPQVQWAMMWWRFGFKQWTPGQQYRLRFTGAITAVVGSWVVGTLTFDQTIPSGIYQIQGMDAFGANLLGARLVFPGGGWRPGVMAHNTLSSMPRPEFTNGGFGVFGEFDSVNPPQLEIYAEAANTAQEGFLDVVRISDR